MANSFQGRSENNIKSIFFFGRLQDKDGIFQSFRNFLVTTIEWVQMSSVFITFFYSDTFFKIIQEKFTDPNQASCVPFVLLSIFTIDLQILDGIDCSDRNFRYTFVSNLEKYLRCTIDKFTELFPSSLSREVIEKLAIESFDSIINILGQTNEQNINGINRFLEKLLLDENEQNNEQFFCEVEKTIFSQLNHRMHLIEQYVTINWRKAIDYMQQQDQLKLFLIQNSELSVQVFDQIAVNFQRLKKSTTSIKQSVEKICQAGIDKADINKRQSNITTIKDDCDRDTITGDNDLEQKAYEFICQLNEEMCKANFVDFPILLDEFYSQKCI